MKYALVMAITAILFAGCVSSKKVIQNKQYIDQDLSDRSVVLFPIPLDAVIITDTARVKEDFAADRRVPSIVVQDSLYRKSIFQTSQSLLMDQLKLKSLPFDLFPTQTDTSRFFVVNLPVRIDKRDTVCAFYVPRKELFPADSIDVGVIITSVTIGTTQTITNYGGSYIPGHTVTTPGGTFSTPGMWLGGGSGLTSEPAAGIQFIMWDYRANTPIVHGFAQATDTKVLSGNPLSTIFRVTAQRLFEYSPFRFRKIVQ